MTILLLAALAFADEPAPSPDNAGWDDGTIATTTEGVPKGFVIAKETSLTLDQAVLIETSPEVRTERTPILPYEVKRSRLVCPVTFYVTAEGSPYALDLNGCPESVWLGADFALMQWRFAASGQAATRFTRKVTFRNAGSTAKTVE